LIYLPAQTLFLKSSAAQGACIKNGLEMLEKQADKAFEIWQNID
jgi:shikimate dehydrogenase